MASQRGVVACTLGELLAYLARLGTLGFGGPIALVGHMERDLVEERGWFTRADYLEGLALAQLAPGPLAVQLAIYLGWVRAGLRGATLAALAFVLPSFFIVLGIAALYVHLGGLPWMQGAFFGVGAAVIAVVARSAVRLGRVTLGVDRLLWLVCFANAVATAWSERESAWLFLASGCIVLAARRTGGTTGLAVVIPGGMAGGAAVVAGSATLLTIFSTFAAAGAFVFGSGLAIVPFLHGGVVERFHWLNDRQFLDAVAVAMITPGPVVITVAFIGYLVAGLAGASVAALGVFLPCYLFVVIPAPHYRRIAGNRAIRAFVEGVTAAATGAIAGAVVVLGRRAIVDVPSALLSVGAMALLLRKRKLPEPLVIVLAGVAGVVWKGMLGR